MKCYIDNLTYYFDQSSIIHSGKLCLLQMGYPTFYLFKDKEEANKLAEEIENSAARTLFATFDNTCHDITFEIDQRQNQDRVLDEQLIKMFGFIPTVAYRI